MQVGIQYIVIKGYVMKKVNRIKGLVFSVTCLLGLIACSDKAPPAEQQLAPDESAQIAKKRLNSFPKADYLTRNIQDEIIYFVEPERFQNANKTTNSLSNIEARLDYIEGLGLTALLMTPVLQNQADLANEYDDGQKWVVDSSKIDPRFGNKTDLKKLIDAAHSRNIKIFFDMKVSQGPDRAKNNSLGAASVLAEAYKSLITEFKPDGFKITKVNHASTAFWQSFAPAITEHAHSLGLNNFFIFGEVLDGKPIEMSQFTTHGQLPSMLDSNFSTNIRDVVFGNQSVNQLHDLFNNDDYYRDNNSSPNVLVNSLSNHDAGRITDFIDTESPGILEADKVARSQVAHALMYFSRGVPAVYPIDEQYIFGSGQDTKKPLSNLLGATSNYDNFDIDHPSYTYFSDLAKVRHAHKSLRQGDHLNRILDEEKSLYGFSRIMPSDMIDHLVVFNFSKQQQQTSIGVGFLEYEKLAGNTNSKFELSGDQLMIDLAPLSYMVLKSNIPLSKSRVLDVNLQSSYEENERVFLSFDLTFTSPEQFNFAQIKVYAVDQDGQKTFLTFDTTAPYRAILQPEQVENLSQIEVLADNFQGQTKTKVFDLSMQ